MPAHDSGSSPLAPNRFIGQLTPARIGQICAVLAFACALCAPALGRLLGWGLSGEPSASLMESNETSRLWNFPQLLDRTAQRLTRDFGFRLPLIRLDVALRRMLGAPESRDVMRGRNDWLFYRGNHSIEQHRGVANFSTTELEAYVAVMDERRRWLQRHGARMIMMVVPDKSSIYPEYLVPLLPQVAPTRLDQLVARIAGTDINLLDLRPALIAAKSTESVYRKTDSHWTSFGAYVGANQFLHVLHPAFPELDSLPVGAWTFQHSFCAGGDLMRMLVNPWDPHETVPIPVRNFSDHVTARSAEPMAPCSADFGVGGWSLDGSIVITDRSTRPKLLVIGDSFAGSLLPFLQQEFSQVEFFQKFSSEECQFIEKYRPDIVLFESAQRYLEENPSNPPEIARDPKVP